MIHTRLCLGIALMVAGVAAGQSHPAEEKGPAGLWRGTSVCMVKDSPCHDEANVYRISTVAGKPQRFTVTAAKIVDGREVEMGPASEWDYDATKQLLVTTVGEDRFRLRVDGDKMEGEISLADGTVYRRTHLTRATR